MARARLAPPSPPTAAHRRLCSSASQLLSACPTSRLRASLSCSFRIHSADLGAIPLGSEAGSPGSRVSNFRTCTGSRDHAGAESFSRLANGSMLPSDPTTTSAPPKSFSFRGSIPGPHVPLSMLRLHSYEYTRMTRGQHGSLLLSCERLSLSATHRFAPAHRRRQVQRLDTLPVRSGKTSSKSLRYTR